MRRIIFIWCKLVQYDDVSRTSLKKDPFHHPWVGGKPGRDTNLTSNTEKFNAVIAINIVFVKKYVK